MTKRILSQKTLKELIHYDPLTGVFTWLPRSIKYFSSWADHASWNSRFEGNMAGGDNGGGYIKIRIFRKNYYAHRLAFLYMTGKYPLVFTDHRKGNKKDNRWSEISSVDNKENSRNASIRKDNTSGVTGISWNKKRRKWEANIQENGKNVHLGMFGDIQQAALARKKAEANYGYHENHGRAKIG